MPDLINWDLLLNPANWLIVILMLAIFVFALRALQEPLASIGAVALNP